MPRRCGGRAQAALVRAGLAPVGVVSEAPVVGGAVDGRLCLAEAEQQFEVELRCGVAGVQFERRGEVRDRGVNLRGAASATRRVEGEDALQRSRLLGD